MILVFFFLFVLSLFPPTLHYVVLLLLLLLIPLSRSAPGLTNLPSALAVVRYNGLQAAITHVDAEIREAGDASLVQRCVAAIRSRAVQAVARAFMSITLRQLAAMIGACTHNFPNISFLLVIARFFIIKKKKKKLPPPFCTSPHLQLPMAAHRARR
jgi:hypothetical protein